MANPSLAYESMLDRIDVHVVDVMAQIRFIANQVFPEAPLPDAAFLARDARARAPFRSFHGMSEQPLDVPLAHRVVGIIRR